MNLTAQRVGESCDDMYRYRLAHERHATREVDHLEATGSTADHPVVVSTRTFDKDVHSGTRHRGIHGLRDVSLALLQALKSGLGHLGRNLILEKPEGRRTGAL